MNEVARNMYSLAQELFPICRSLTGNGVRQTLDILKREVGSLNVHEVPTGTQCFDWTVPKEWNIRDAYIIDPDGKKICQFNESNLHVVGYSTPVSKTINLEELQMHLSSLPEQPDAIPYVTSYYNDYWGFCITDKERKNLKKGLYQVYIDSELKDGSLTYGELILPGETSQEVFLSTYICHPSMANNELSGPVVVTQLVKWLLSLEKRKYTYRVVFIPETIGSITYLSRNLDEMQKNVVAGFNITCVGDERDYSYLPSRLGNTLADKAALHILQRNVESYSTYSFLDRGSDERQYCSPGVDLPVCSIMRTKYGCYPEYHTSLDDLNLVTGNGLYGAFNIIRKTLEVIESNAIYKPKYLCEPQLGKRGLYPNLSTKGSAQSVELMMNILAYADGSNDVIDLSDLFGVDFSDIIKVLDRLSKSDLLERCE
ncbi:DUF4910 domain-containing protein [Vibrio splendidus]